MVEINNIKTKKGLVIILKSGKEVFYPIASYDGYKIIMPKMLGECNHIRTDVDYLQVYRYWEDIGDMTVIGSFLMSDVSCILDNSIYFDL